MDDSIFQFDANSWQGNVKISEHDQQASLVSVIVPMYNEIDNVLLMYEELTQAMLLQSRQYEIVIVDDGSLDGTVDRLKEIAKKDNRVKLVLLRRNFGQTAAMQAGIEYASGEYLVTIDGDLQNDPADIPMMLDHLDEGYDLIHGWRRDRKDKLISRKIPSRVANWLISKVTGFPINDLGCTLKAMRAEVANELELYGEMHRFIPILAHKIGAKSREVVTHHRARQHGTTKYGIGRTFRVVFDLITIKFMLSYFASPMKLFGKLGGLVGLAGFISLFAAGMMKVFGAIDLTGNPLLLMGVLSIILSAQFFSLGVIGEVCARIYYSHPTNSNFHVRKLVNLEPQKDSSQTQTRQVA